MPNHGSRIATQFEPGNGLVCCAAWLLRASQEPGTPHIASHTEARTGAATTLPGSLHEGGDSDRSVRDVIQPREHAFGVIRLQLDRRVKQDKLVLRRWLFIECSLAAPEWHASPRQA